MENKLVFEPTTLTQYNWRKYQLLSTYTYYWKVHTAIAEYLYTYYWNKYEVIPNSGYVWDRYKVYKDYPTAFKLYTEQTSLGRLQNQPNRNDAYDIQSQPYKESYRLFTFGDYYDIFGRYPDECYISNGKYIKEYYQITIKVVVYSSSHPNVIIGSDNWITVSATSYPRSFDNYISQNLPMTFGDYKIWFYIEPVSQNRMYKPNINEVPARLETVYPTDIGWDRFYGGITTIDDVEYYYKNYQSNIYTDNPRYYRDTFIDEVIDENPNKYPHNGRQGDYWYVYYGYVNTDYKYVYTRPLRKLYYMAFLYAFYPSNVSIAYYTYQFYSNYSNQTSYHQVLGYLKTATTSEIWRNYLISNGLATEETYTNFNLLLYGRDTYGSYTKTLYNNPAQYLTYYNPNSNYSLTNFEDTGQDRYLSLGSVIGFNGVWGIPENVNVKVLPIDYPKILYDVNFHNSRVYFPTGIHLEECAVYDVNKLYEGSELRNLVLAYNDADTIYENECFGPNYFTGETQVDDANITTKSNAFHTSHPYYFGLVPTGDYDEIESENYTVYSYKGANDATLIANGFTYQTRQHTDGYELTFLGTVSSEDNNAYPQNGLAADGYYYIYDNSTAAVIGYHPGSYISDVITTNPLAYPQDGYDYNTGKYYIYRKMVIVYNKGNYLGNVSSYIEAAYPQNSYILNDSWYVYQNSNSQLTGTLIIDETKLMGGVNYTQEINPSEDLMIGAGGAAQVSFTIFAPDAAAVVQYLGKDFTYYVKMNSDEDWRQVGVFTLTKADLPDKQTAKIEGFDYIYKFDVVVDEWLDNLNFPMTLEDLFKSLCQYVGCEAYSGEFNNNDFMVNDNFEAVQITGRTILQYITEVSGGFCVAEPDGRIHIKQYSIPPTGTINLGNDSYVKYTHEIYNVPVITSVVVRKDDEDEGVESNV